MRIVVADFDLAATLECGQAFRWQRQPDGWFAGVVGHEVWRLRQDGNVIVAAGLRRAEVASATQAGADRGGDGGRGLGVRRRSPDRAGESTPQSQALPCRSGNRAAAGSGVGRGRETGAQLQWDTLDWETDSPSAIQNRKSKILHYLALDISLPAIAATFPDDPVLREAVKQHWGLRVLRQAPWETLASFIASSTKQIVQIRQIVAELARRFGEPIADGHYSFPAVDVIARATQQQLWDCKLGFRAKNLLAAARLIDSGKCDLAGLSRLEFDRAVEELDKLPGVGEKITLCTLLFSGGFNQAFPIDVWVERALRRLYFPEQRVTRRELREFTRSHFGPNAGWAQQYLFFGERLRGRNRNAIAPQKREIPVVIFPARSTDFSRLPVPARVRIPTKVGTTNAPLKRSLS